MSDLIVCFSFQDNEIVSCDCALFSLFVCVFDVLCFFFVSSYSCIVTASSLIIFCFYALSHSGLFFSRDIAPSRIRIDFDTVSNFRSNGRFYKLSTHLGGHFTFYVSSFFFQNYYYYSD